MVEPTTVRKEEANVFKVHSGKERAIFTYLSNTAVKPQLHGFSINYQDDEIRAEIGCRLSLMRVSVAIII